MAQNLTVIEPLKLPDLARPDRMPSLPEWVASRLASVSEAQQKDASGKHRAVMTLPQAMMLGSSEIRQIGAYAGALGKTLSRTPSTSADAEAETLVHVTKLMLALPGMRSSETGAEATGEAYQAALDDLPPWAVAAAIRHWYRGDAMQIGKQPHDYRWRPAPAALRYLAFVEASAVRARMQQLEQLITAVPLIEYSAEHRTEMREKLTNASPILRAIIANSQADAPAPQPAERVAAE